MTLEDNYQFRLGAISNFPLPEPDPPEPALRAPQSIEPPFSPNCFACTNDLIILEQRLFTQISALLVEHRTYVSTCFDRLSEQLSAQMHQSHAHRISMPQEKIKEHSCATDVSVNQERPGKNAGPQPDISQSIASSQGLSVQLHNSGGSFRGRHAPKAHSAGQRWFPKNNQTGFQRILSSLSFQFFSALAISSNAFMIGWEVEHMSQHPESITPAHFVISSHIYAAIFLLEFLIRLLAEQHTCFKGDELYWNAFDLLVVSSAFLESAIQLFFAGESSGIEFMGELSSMRIIRIFRVLRVVRVARVARVIRIIASLRTLVYSIASTLKDLFWTVCLLCMIIYMSGILFTQAFIDHYSLRATDDLELWWGSLFRSMLTLYKVISNGVSWHDPASSLQNVNIGYVWLLMVYVFFTYFAVLNVITGIFCNSAIETAARNPDLIATSLLMNKKQLTDRLRKLFDFIDDDGSGEITEAELEILLADEEMQAYFEAIGLEAQDAWLLFRLIDVDKTQTIEVDEFISGVMRLKGEARAIDVAVLLLDQNRVLRKISEMMRFLKKAIPTE